MLVTILGLRILVIGLVLVFILDLDSVGSFVVAAGVLVTAFGFVADIVRAIFE